MGKKIFVSYKYADDSVKQLPYNYFNMLPAKTTVRKYVDILEETIGKDNIYKGEHDGEDLSKFTDDTIWSELKDRIFDSSVTIVMISPGMKDFWKNEKEQWIPQEISYSLKEFSRATKDGQSERKSRTNAMIAIVLPDRSGYYNYYMKGLDYNKNITFDIINRNMFNNRENFFDSYIVTVKWEDFIKNPNTYIERAVYRQENIYKYNIRKIL